MRFLHFVEISRFLGCGTEQTQAAACKIVSILNYTMLSRFCDVDPRYELAKVSGLPVEEQCTANHPLRFETSSIMSE